MVTDAQKERSLALHCFSKSTNAGMMIVALLTSINEENVVQVPLKIFLSVPG